MWDPRNKLTKGLESETKGQYHVHTNGRERTFTLYDPPSPRGSKPKFGTQKGTGVRLFHKVGDPES